MERRARQNAVLALLAAVLAALALLLPEDEPAPAVAFEVTEIERIEAHFPQGGEPIRLRRAGDGWDIAEPDARPAHPGRIARLLASLRERTRSCYPAAGHDPAAFGLEPPQAELDLGGTRVALGDRAPDGRRYLLSAGRICLVDDIALPLLRGGADSLAQPRRGD